MSLLGLGLLVLSAPWAELPLPEGFAYPNGIAARADGTLLVGSVTSAEILERSPEGKMRVFHAADAHPEALFAGTALELDDDRNLLWVASPDFSGRGTQGRRAHRYAVLDATSGTLVASRAVPEGGFVNDVALDGQGGAYLTDSTLGRIWHVRSPKARPEVYVQDPLLQSSGIGPAGIVRCSDGSLVVGLYEAGTLFRISGKGRVAPMKTARPLRYLDGLELGEDGTLYAIEGGIDDGEGRVLAVDVGGPAPHGVEVLAEGLDTPVNLTRVGTHLHVTESRFRHRMRPQLRLEAPTRWRTVDLELGSKSRIVGELPDNFHPESIAFARGVFYVGSATRSEIFALRRGAKPRTFVPAGSQGLMSVQGLLAVPEEGRLYACTGNLGKHRTRTSSSALLAFDLETGAPRGRWPMDGRGFCNDLVAWDGGYLITDTYGARIWRFEPGGTGELGVWLEDERLEGANGIAAQGEDIYVSTFASGRLLRVSTRSGGAKSLGVVELPRSFDGGDGLRALSNGRLLVFENGLVHGQGSISLVRVEGVRVELTRIVSSASGPVSGVVVADEVVWPASNFAVLFGGAARTRRDARVHSTRLPVRVAGLR